MIRNYSQILHEHEMAIFILLKIHEVFMKFKIHEAFIKLKVHIQFMK